MARALSNGKALFASLSARYDLHSDAMLILASGRAFSAAPAAGRAAMAEEKAVLMMGNRDTAGSAVVGATAAASAWVPDPVTGYYRPANRLREMDPAELRHLLLKNRA